ncbi:MAG: dihydroorotase [Candidatus Aminicenantes bacterium]|nr:dihydroorotase [Candidatus Aminicenantes bacterium]
MKLLVRGGRVVDPGTAVDGCRDVLIEDGRIVAVEPRIEAGEALLIDASGLVVAPGFIDMHVHLREPGQEHKETIETGAWAAAAGGFTSICAMPNTNPVNDRPEITRLILARAAGKAVVNVFPIAAMTLGLRGMELVDMAALAAAGAVAFSDDGRCLQNAALMRRAMETARGLGKPITDHCEDASLAGSGVMHEGPWAARLGLSGIPAAAEDVMVARDAILAEALGAPVHIAHLSTAGSVRIVRQAKRRGVPITAEATPHHLTLTDAALETGDARFKMNPPLRGEEDVAALLEAVADGTIDVLATDHAPHTTAEKAVGIAAAPFGIVGLETAVPLLLDRLVGRNLIGLARFVALWSTRPAEILGLRNKGRLSAGADADLTILDLDRSVVVDSGAFHSKSRNTPFDGWALRGAAVRTIVGGHPVFPKEQP